jgi:hypothetical protein
MIFTSFLSLTLALSPLGRGLRGGVKIPDGFFF